ncbi:MAG: methyltransferase [Candidatus Kerfeldbacteria bacterium]|nr:methyltransferase [Candidatus Kerfeldbacteria bacterium]
MRKPLPQIEQLTIEKIVHGGQALGHALNRPIFVWNALPGEIVDVQVTRKNSKICEGVATHIVKPSPLRIEPQEEHWLSCSPWQIISRETEKEWKMSLAREAYIHAGIDVSQMGFVESPSEFGYRNKIEWSFAANEDGLPSLAFFSRGTHVRQALDMCVLASPMVTKISQRILEWIREQTIPLRSLKSLIVRSADNGTAIAGLFLKDQLTFPTYPQCNKELLGFHVYYSSHKSPASVVHGVLHSDGVETLSQRVLDTELIHGLNGFFQVNIPVFEQAVKKIDEYIPQDRPLLDFYGGVGSIGIPLARMHQQQLTIVESNAESTTCAQKNIERYQLRAQVCSAEAEKAVEYISSDATLIVDPPRAGLHQDVIDRIGVVQPEVIAYISCNVSTHARDIQLLSKWYKVTFLSLFNFFPRTPHVEALCILKKK